MDDLTRISAMLSAQQFLIGQLYARLFLADHDARARVPDALIEAATYKSHTQADLKGEALVEMQAQVVVDLRHFFADVEQRVKEAQGRHPL